MQRIQVRIVLLLVAPALLAQAPATVTYTIASDQASVTVNGTTPSTGSVAICVTTIYLTRTSLINV
jgi:hypothetical protein